MKIGYARVSTGDQNPQLQLDALQQEKVSDLFIGAMNGTLPGNILIVR